MLDTDGHDNLVARFYAAAGGESGWTDVLARMADAFGSSLAAMHFYDAAKGKVVSSRVHGVTAEFAEAFYASETFANDPRQALISALPPDVVYFDRMLYDPELDQDPRCAATIEALGVKHQLGIGLRLPGNVSGGMALLSTEREGHPSEEAITAFRRLMPHFRQACTMGLLIEQEAYTREALLETMARKADGLVLLNPCAEPAFMNEAASRILGGADGIEVTGGEFVTCRAAETRKLSCLIRKACAASLSPLEAPGGHMLVTRPSGRRPYLVSVMPAPKLDRFLTRTSIACVVYLHDLAIAHLPSREILSSAFGLSEREADLAIELARCAALDDAAANAEMALNTARNHLQGIFRKTETASQAEAIQLLGRLV